MHIERPRANIERILLFRPGALVSSCGGVVRTSYGRRLLFFHNSLDRTRSYGMSITYVETVQVQLSIYWKEVWAEDSNETSHVR